MRPEVRDIDGIAPGPNIRRARAVTVAVLIAVYVLWAWRWAHRALSEFEVFQTGDWLLNYQGGYVRRGLIGEIIWRFTPVEGSLVLTATVIQLVIMGLLMTAVVVLVLRVRAGPAWFMLVLSPAFLLFPLVNPLGGVRKEVLGLLALAILAVNLGARRWRLWSTISAGFFAIATLSHEANVVLLPAWLFLLWRSHAGERHRSWRWGVAMAAVVSAVAASLTAATIPGTPAIAARICQSWQARDVTECGSGALDALTLSVQMSRDVLIGELFPGYWLYGVAFVLALIPLVVTRYLPSNWLVTALTVFAALPLFWIAWDYGRWIFLIIGALSICALALGARVGAPRAMHVPWAVAILYCILWGVNYFGNPAILKGPVLGWIQSGWEAVVG